jgi:hypothetical protein
MEQRKISQEQSQIMGLLVKGFTRTEAVRLSRLRVRISEDTERIAYYIEENDYMIFARWLYEQGVLNEDKDEDEDQDE